MGTGDEKDGNRVSGVHHICSHSCLCPAKQRRGLFGGVSGFAWKVNDSSNIISKCSKSNAVTEQELSDASKNVGAMLCL